MRAYKFLLAESTGQFSGFRWPLPNGGPGAWVDAAVDPCRSGIHACRPADLPYWVGQTLYEVELAGEITEFDHKIVAPRGRLVRRVEAWTDATRDEYSLMCIARAHELAEAADRPLEGWAPPEEAVGRGPALMGYITARIAEELGGKPAFEAERARQTAWLVERLGL
jgi:hypothetical protein